VAAAVASADVVITLLPNGKIVREAVNALREHLKPTAILVDMSSSDPILTRKLGEELIAAGFEFVMRRCRAASSAPPRDARHHGGRRRRRHRPRRGAARRHGHVDLPHRRARLRSCHEGAQQLRLVGRLIAAVEALRIGRKIRLDPALMTDILNVSSGKNNTTEVKLKQFIISETFADGFPLRLMAKDVRTADDMAHALGIPTPLADLCAQLWMPPRSRWTRKRITRKCCAIGRAGRVSAPGPTPANIAA